MTIQEMQQKKIELGLTSQMIAEASGVPLSTVQKLFSGTTKAPRKATIDAIVGVLRNYEMAHAPGNDTLIQDRSHDISGISPDGTPHAEPCGLYDSVRRDIQSGMVRDSALVSPYTRQGTYTIEDYYALPEEQRVELIDGVFYDMGAPAMIHQLIIGELHVLFRECISRHGKQCRVILSPCDVRLDKDNRTMVQPDLLVICHDFDIHARAYNGAPDLVVEVVSPSSRSKDMLLKLHKYYQAGVREYWIVDVDARTVVVYDLQSDNFYPEKYPFNSVIPIQISEGECSIDFSVIDRGIAEYYEVN